MNIWVAEYKDEVTGGLCHEGVFLTEKRCVDDHMYFGGMEFVRAVEFVPQEDPVGKEMDRTRRDNWFLNIEKDSLQRFLSKKGLLDEYRQFTVDECKKFAAS